MRLAQRESPPGPSRPLGHAEGEALRPWGNRGGVDLYTAGHVVPSSSLSTPPATMSEALDMAISGLAIMPLDLDVAMSAFMYSPNGGVDII